MGRLVIMEAECKYKELDKHLKEQFINGLKDDGMMVEIVWEHTSVVNTSSVTSTEVMVWARRVETQGT